MWGGDGAVLVTFLCSFSWGGGGVRNLMSVCSLSYFFFFFGGRGGGGNDKGGILRGGYIQKVATVVTTQSYSVTWINV